MGHPPEYDVAAVLAAIAEDQQTSELGLELIVEDDGWHLTGVVASVGHRDAVERVVHQHATGVRIHNDLQVEHPEVSDEAEELL